MRTLRLFLRLIAVTGIFFLWSCNDDNDDHDVIETTTIQEFFTIEDLAVTSGNYQTQSNASRIAELISNGSFLQGGLVPVRIQTTEPVAYFLIGMRNARGFYNQNATAVATDQPNEYLIYLHIQQGVTANQIVVLLTEYTADNVGGRTQELLLTNHGNISGVFQISMTWDQPNDLDLHVLQPNGEIIYYGNSESSNGAFLDVDSNAACDLDNINNENISFGDEAVIYNGEYIVYVDLWSSCDVVENTNFGVTTTYHGNHIAVTQGENPYYGTVAADVDDMIEVMRFTITDGVQPPANKVNMNPNNKNLSPFKN